MLSLFDERTLFQAAVDRLEGVFADDQIFVVTVAEQAVELQAQCPQIPKENFINEPMPRGTASVVGLAAVALQKRDPEAVMAILTADHYIGNEDNFRQLLRTAYQVAQNGHLVTLGISPTYPATGYGYIQRGERLDEYTEAEVYRVRRFKEKPDEQQAQQMLESGDHAWNSGMFVWRVDGSCRSLRLRCRSLTKACSSWRMPGEQKATQMCLIRSGQNSRVKPLTTA
jgi:mannose-1-phosphate guanylyltransferase